MRILIANHARGSIGGVETFLRGVTPALAARGHTIAVLFERRCAESETGPDPYANCDTEWIADEIGAEAAVRGARAWAPDMVWMHHLFDPALEHEIVQVGPCVLHAHGFDGTCATGTRLQMRPRPHPCRRRLGPACLAQNYLHGCGLRNPAVLYRQYRANRSRQRALGDFERILTCSQFLARELVRHGAPVERLLCANYPLLQEPGPPPPARTAIPSRILCLARLTYGKGLHVLLEAMVLAQTRLRRRLTLTVGGEGPELPRLVAQAQRLGLDVRWLGWIHAAERQRELEAADLLAVPSIFPEPFGIVGQEGQAAGVPAAAFAVGGIPEWLRDGESGELAPGETPNAEDLARAIGRALGSRARLERLRHGAWRDSHRYSLADFLNRLESVFEAARRPDA